ncbi:MAG TPA: GNAT family N-acetyltransferase [Gaiellaceae bacterium]|nr:GNAT family N-acetyltransferase [Gaiellaceae bacterium]
MDEPSDRNTAGSMEPIIRDARADDAHAVTGLIGELGYPTMPDAVLRRLERLTSSEADRVLVAEVDGEVVGLASVHISHSVEYDEPAAKLSAIVVGGNYRGRGIGAALVAAIETEARSRGCSLLSLTTAEHRTGAHSFYREVGFEETGRRFAKRLA